MEMVLKKFVGHVERVSYSGIKIIDILCVILRILAADTICMSHAVGEL